MKNEKGSSPQMLKSASGRKASAVGASIKCSPVLVVSEQNFGRTLEGRTSSHRFDVLVALQSRPDVKKHSLFA